MSANTAQAAAEDHHIGVDIVGSKSKRVLIVVANPAHCDHGVGPSVSRAPSSPIPRGDPNGK
jgi:hypothetical protein